MLSNSNKSGNIFYKIAPTTHHVHSMLKRRGNSCFCLDILENQTNYFVDGHSNQGQ